MISPLSPTRFVAEEFPIRLEIEFEKNEEANTYVVHAWTEGKKLGLYEAVEVTEPTPEELEVYVGEYYSEELDTAYFLRLKKGNLYMQHRNPHKNFPKAALKPTFKDRFQVERWKLNFVRNESQDIVGFKVNAGRVQNILFEKQ
jgi:hypothetical protein